MEIWDPQLEDGDDTHLGSSQGQTTIYLLLLSTIQEALNLDI